MGEQDEPLELVDFDLAATRPATLFGLPYALSAVLMLGGILFLSLYQTGSVTSDTIGDAVAIGADLMAWSAIKIMLQSDYHGWGNFVAWLRLDARCLDTAEWGGARPSPFPLRSAYRTAMHHAA